MPKVKTLHSWELTTSEARELQLELASRVDATSALAECETLAGADVSYDLRGKWLYAAVVVLAPTPANRSIGRESCAQRSSPTCQAS